jgi:Fur family ferric uptake transcriptional regulator
MSQENINAAKKLLEEYIENKKLRKNPSRFALLEYVYLYEGHFTAETLLEYALKQGCKVSRATVYNTIELFLEANLITKHRFWGDKMFYEKSLNVKYHHHYVCTECGTIKDLKDEGIIRTAIKTKRIAKFRQTDYFLCIYGVCASCSKT